MTDMIIALLTEVVSLLSEILAIVKNLFGGGLGL